MIEAQTGICALCTYAHVNLKQKVLSEYIRRNVESYDSRSTSKIKMCIYTQDEASAAEDISYIIVERHKHSSRMRVLLHVEETSVLLAMCSKTT